MLPDRVSNPGPLTYESGALPIALCGPASESEVRFKIPPTKRWFEKALRRMEKLKMIELLPLKVYSAKNIGL